MPAQNADEVLRWTDGGTDGRVALPHPALPARASRQPADARGFGQSARLNPPHSHRRFHLNRNLFDKNIRPRPERCERGTLEREVKGRKESEGRTVSRLQVVALTGPPVNLGEKSIHPSASVKEEACSFLTSVEPATGRGTMFLRGRGSAPVQARQPARRRFGHGCGSSPTSSLAPSIRRNRGRRAGHFLAAVAVTADAERGGREGETPLTKRKAERSGHSLF